MKTHHNQYKTLHLCLYLPEDKQDAVSGNGFTFCWDNVGIQSTARHQTTSRQNKYHLWALAYLEENRISSLGYDWHDPNKPASEIPLKDFLPGENDFANLRYRMKVIIQRILINRIPFFKGIAQATKHIPHDYSQESSKKSKIVCIIL